MNLHVVILAAGQGTRMRSALPKVLHTIGGQAMLAHVLKAAQGLNATSIHVVHGHSGGEIQAAFAHWSADQTPLIWCHQAQQLGTGHAVAQALAEIPNDARVLVLYGDVPLIPTALLHELADRDSNHLALLIARVADPRGYGRIVCDNSGRVSAIVEEKDASDSQRRINEINTGVMMAPAASLRGWLSKIGNDNASGEYYLTSVIALASKAGIEIVTVEAPNPEDVLGVNDRVQLAHQERRFQAREAERLMREGLGLADPARFDLRGELTIGREVFIDVGVVIEGKVILGDGVHIGPYCVLRDTAIGVGTRVESHSVFDNASVGEDCRIGPFARLRPGAQLADRVHVGNYVEIKKSSLGNDSKANHHAYLGDATIGARVNIGAGVITCNYDGTHKNRTIIGDDVFVGTDSQLIAPLTIGDGAYIGAGSTIAQNVAADSLTICRARDQKSIPGWSRLRKKL